MARFCITVKKDGEIQRQSGHSWKESAIEDFKSEIAKMRSIEERTDIPFNTYEVKFRKKNSNGNKKYQKVIMNFKDGQLWILI